MKTKRKSIQKSEKKNPHAVALGRLGGKIGGKISGKRLAQQRGSAYMAKLARKSHKTTLLKYGPDYYERIQRGEKPSKD